MQTILELHRRATVAVLPVVAAVGTADLTLPTPCAGWNLRTLLEHMIGQDHGFAAAARSDVGADAFAPQPFDGAPADAHAAGIADVVSAFAAARPDRAVPLAELGNHQVPLTLAVSFHLVDTLVHGWDVAAAIGVDVAFDDDIVAAGLAVAERVPGGETREVPGASFGPVVALGDGHDAWERTLALLGRDPAWRPAVRNG